MLLWNPTPSPNCSFMFGPRRYEKYNEVYFQWMQDKVRTKGYITTNELLNYRDLKHIITPAVR
jgi:hypothetical protein